MEPEAGRQGIALRLSEWNNLKESITQLHATMPDLALALPCSYSTDNANLLGYMSCKECSPFEIIDLYIPNELSSDTGKDTCDYEAMTNHAFTARTRRVRLRCNEPERRTTQLRSNVQEEEEGDELDVLNF